MKTKEEEKKIGEEKKEKIIDYLFVHKIAMKTSTKYLSTSKYI